MQGPKHFPFYKHLVAQECRKDIILENDFTNTRTRDRNTSFFAKYKDKATKNKMRIAYLAGFSVVFSLNYIYDAFFQSFLYAGLVDRLQRVFGRLNDNTDFNSVDYSSRGPAELGNYFRRLEQLNCTQEITPAALSARSPAFRECQNESFDVNSFVTFCLNHGITYEQLPPPSPL